MDSPLVIGLAAVVGVLVGGLGGFLIAQARSRERQERERSAAEDEGSRILARAREEAENQRRTGELEGKEAAMRLRETWEQEEGRRREEAERLELRLVERSESLDGKFDVLDKREVAQERRTHELDAREKDLALRAADVDRLAAEARVALEALAGMSAAEAKQRLMDDIRQEAEADAANTLRSIREEAQRTAEREAKKIVALAIQRMAADQTAEMTVAVVQLPSDEMKGRIIGREGRNIRSFEQATGIDVIIDDTPEAVVLSGFDPVRREVARMALERLIEDGRIHPGRIEEIVARTRSEIDLVMRQAGETAAYDSGVPGLPPEIIRLLGRLKYRTSYGQNVLQHVVETSRLAAIIAAEVGADVQICKTGGLLHDIGKAIDHEVEGPHAAIGAQFAARLGLAPQVVNSIAAHHQEVEYTCVEAPIVQIADAISASRPGARGESVETYLKRLDDLQAIAGSFSGVEKAFAVQAGREVRILVRPTEIDDLASMRLARDIVRKIEESLTYPGQIKVTVIRETRAVEYAK